jgi:rubrerythrin
MMDIRKILEYALAREHMGKSFFLENAEKLQNAAAAGAFKIIAGEEQKHIDFIDSMLNSIDSGKTADSPQLPEAGFFSDRADSESIDQTVSESMVSDLPVLRMAYLIEHDFVEFYASASKQAEGEAKALLELLTKWESSHEHLFKRMHDKLFEMYSNMPWGG